MSYVLTDLVSTSSMDNRSKRSGCYSDKPKYSTKSSSSKNIMSWNLLKCNNDDVKDNVNEQSSIARFSKHNSFSSNKTKEEIYDTVSKSNIIDRCLPKRSGAASVLYKSSIYIFGGYRMRKRLNDLYKYDIIANKWSKIPTTKFTPSARENNPAVCYKNKMYIYGGYQGNKKWLHDFHCFNMETHQWAPVEVKEKSKIYAPPNLYGFSVAVDERDGIIYFFGGYDGTKLYNKMFAFHIKKSKWIRVSQSGDCPSPRSCANAHIINGYFYIFGGYNGTNSLNSLYQYHIETGVWTNIPYNVNISDDEENEQEEEDDGTDCDKTNPNATFGFNNKLKSVTNKKSDLYKDDENVPSPRYFVASFLFDKYIYILGGYDGYSKRYNDFYKFDIYQRVWTKIDTINNFTERSSMNVHFFKNVVYCIAGYDGTNVLNDVYALKLENTYVEASSYVDDCKLMINNPKYSDVVFLVQNKHVYACKAILSVRCPYFFELFRSYFSEKNMLNHQVPIMIHDVHHETFLYILKYLYTDQLSTNYTLDVYVNILLAAIKFDIFRLVQLCEMAICRYIDHFNVLDVTILSYRNECQQLCRFCVDYLINNKLLNDEKINKLVNEPQLLAEIYRRTIKS